MFRYLLCLFGILLAIPALVLTSLTFVTPISTSGVIYLLGCWLIAAGLMLAPWRRKTPLALMASGMIAIVLMAGARLSLIRNQPSSVNVIVLPSAKETRWINWLIDEEDSVLFGEEILYRMSGVTAHEHDNIVPALSTAYTDARSTQGVAASPFIGTYLGFQKPTAFDAIVIEPPVESPPSIGVVFLHGFMGNVAIQCWQIAQAASPLGAITVCPSTSWIGDWWKPDGEAIVQATLSYLRRRGIQRLYLGGYSNGGQGIGNLISRLAAEPSLRGLFFIAGMSNGAGVRETNLPVLVIQGRDDERMPVEAARQFTGEIGRRATYVELEADHFLIMKESRQVQATISQWLKDQELGK